MKSLLSRHGVHSTEDLERAGGEASFKSEMTAFWKAIPEAEGARISLIVVLSTIAIAMGGVGIAAGGGAIGLPLLAIHSACFVLFPFCFVGRAGETFPGERCR